MSILLVASSKFPLSVVRTQLLGTNQQRLVINHHSRALSSAFNNNDLHKKTKYRGKFITEFKGGHPNPVNLFLNFQISPEISGCNLSVRCLHFSGQPNEKASSKVEETVKRLQEKQEESGKPEPLKAVTSEVKQDVVLKKSLWEKFVDECKHYYSGFKLLALDVRVSSGIVWKILNGHQLTRRESRQLVRTTSDLFRLVPFSVFVIVPFMELLLPVALKLFPGMLPSTFTTKSEREAKMKRTLLAKLEYAKFLQKTLDEMALSDRRSRDSKSAADFVDFYQRIKTQGSGIVTNEEILKYSKLFEDSITLDNMTRSQLSAICRLLELTPIGTSNFLRLQIEMRLRQLKTDDKMIIKEGLSSLSVQELQVACRDRGMRAVGLTEAALKKQLEQWLDLSQNAKLPSSLLLLSRTLYFAESADVKDQLAATISSLPESAAAATRQQIGEREGKIRNVERLEQIKEEQRKIIQEAEEKIKMEESRKKADAAAIVKAAVMSEAASAKLGAEITKPAVEAAVEQPAPSVETLVKESIGTLRRATVSSNGDLKEDLIDKAPVLTDKAEVMQESVKSEDSVASKGSKDFDASTISELKTAMEALGMTQSKELEDIKALKKELEDYEEDLKNLDLWKEISQRFDLRETKGAKRLYIRVNKMLGRVNTLVASLEQKEKEIKSKESRSEAEQEQDAENLVTIQELIDAVTKLQSTPDSPKLEQIAEVLSMMDVDEDGVIQLEHVFKVIELLGTEHIKVPEKQMRQIIEMMTKEEMFDVTKKLESILEPRSSQKETSSVHQNDESLSKVSDSSNSHELSEEHFEEKRKSQQNGSHSKH